MYEYDTYVDARKELPRLREPLQAMEGEWYLVKSDVLAGTMTFSSSKDAMINVTTLPISRVREIMALNRQGKKVEQLQHADDIRPAVEEPTYRSEEDSITRFDQAKRRKRGGRNKGRGEQGDRPANDNRQVSPAQQDTNGQPRQPREGQPRQDQQRRRNDRPQNNGERQNGNNGGNGRPQGEPRNDNNGNREARENNNREPRENNGNREGGNRNRNNRNRRRGNGPGNNGGNNGNGGNNAGGGEGSQNQ